ncbi:hypothetical protein LA080_014192 [Diaporthe eres]|nr:hypothetical protein LA080_014192 [Diaporthe eres]
MICVQSPLRPVNQRLVWTPCRFHGHLSGRHDFNLQVFLRSTDIPAGPVGLLYLSKAVREAAASQRQSLWTLVKKRSGPVQGGLGCDTSTKTFLATIEYLSPAFLISPLQQELGFGNDQSDDGTDGSAELAQAADGESNEDGDEGCLGRNQSKQPSAVANIGHCSPRSKAQSGNIDDNGQQEVFTTTLEYI